MAASASEAADGAPVAEASAAKRDVRKGLIGIGSNVGDRRANLQAAVDALRAAGIVVHAASSLYDTDPVGEVLDQPSFLNGCLLIETSLAPLELLDEAKRIERELGRAAEGLRHGPRPIDIDILLLGELELEHERMILPHREVLSRRFVLIPALELDRSLRTPGGVALADALAELPLTEGVRWAQLPPAIA
ncbi:MAG TPA: 2-amino-4-hydroxy-6-hydroxymethyldihydropteridine diphosphokinase [Solirubrobacteraceae bacterium]|jgi:2-amino-4-hydroxy-6-hydroxymethyldihydropteridine diphosphokinase